MEDGREFFIYLLSSIFYPPFSIFPLTPYSLLLTPSLSFTFARFIMDA